MEWFYVFVRADISLADQVCQVAHVCVEAAKRFVYGEGCNLVLLHVADREALLEARELCRRSGVYCVDHFEPDDGIGLAAVATWPIKQEQRKLFRGFKLWK